MDVFTINHRGTLHRLADLPTGLKCVSYYFCHLAEVSTRHLREPLPNPTEHTPACIRTISPRDKDPPGATCATRDGEVPDYSRRTWTTSYLLPTPKTQPYNSVTAFAVARPPRARTHPPNCHWSLHKPASTSASRSPLQPLPSEPLHRNCMSLQPSPGTYCNALRKTPDGYQPKGS
jgi:hypothetical protein